MDVIEQNIELFRKGQTEFLLNQAFVIFTEADNPECRLEALKFIHEIQGELPARAEKPSEEIMDLVLRWCRDESLAPRTIARLNFMTRNKETQKAILEYSIKEDSKELLYPKWKL